MNIHASARAGNTIYWLGSLDNTNSGEVVPAHDTIFAATITGSGANTELTYLGSYTGLREDLIEWDNTNGAPLGLAASAAPGQAGERANGFKLEGVEFLPGSSTEAYLTFRAPLEPACTKDRNREDLHPHLALVIPVTNFSSLFTDGNPGTTHATFGTPLEWNLGGLSIRQIRKNAEGEYVIVASTANSSDTVFQLWGWDGEPEDEPVLLNASIPLGRRRRVGARSPRCRNRSPTATESKCCRTTARPSGTAPAPKTPKRASRRACRRTSGA